jgi:glycine cleavage system aminomethyltransferase T
MLAYVNGLFGGFAEVKEVMGCEVAAVAADRMSEYRNIREDVGILPMTFTVYFKIIGDEAEEHLDYLLTKSVPYLNYGQNRLCYFLDEAGEIKALVTLYKNDDHFIVEAFKWNEQAVAEALRHKGVSFEMLDFSCILLEGYKAADFISQELELSVDYFVYQSHQELEVFDQNILVARIGYTGEFGYKLIGASGALKRIWHRILPAHKDKISGFEAYKMCQYEIKQPFWDLPYLTLSKNIFETDYHWFVDFKKDVDYSGKDALYNDKIVSLKQRLIGALSDIQAQVDSDVLLENNVVGKVADSRYSYGLKKFITMIMMDDKYAQAKVPVRTADGISMVTASAPYIYPASWKVTR